MKRDGLLLIALPSGASDWFASCIQEANPHFVYAREYFCPSLNWRHAERLEQTLGDTLAHNLGNLTRPRNASEIESLLQATWRTGSANFAKENYIAFQAEAFAEFFDCVFLLRAFTDTFPPNRHRVTQWYEHFYESLAMNDLLSTFERSNASTAAKRAAIGHYWFARRLCEAAHNTGSPLFRLSEIQSGRFPLITYAGFNAAEFRERVQNSQEARTRPDDEYYQQFKPAFSLYNELENRFGPIGSAN